MPRLHCPFAFLPRLTVVLILGVTSLVALDEDRTSTAPPDRGEVSYFGTPLSPAEAIAGMELPPGYRLEVVLAEPDIEEPVLAVFNGNGRMYVAEMRTYMLDADSTGEFLPTSRVSLHEDRDGDGTYETHSVFADNLLLPRVILPLADSVVIGETNTNDLYEYRDTDGDGVADEKTRWWEGGERGGNLEHQPSGLIWAMDNGIYTTYNDWRYRYTTGTVEKEEIPLNNGQWGLSQDDWGKVWWVRAGSEIGPVHFQAHILYGQFHLTGEREPGYKTVWPLAQVPDTQGGRPLLREDNTLNHFTATCGPDIFRGDRLPADLRGDLLFAEPVGRLIRRTRIDVQDGVVTLRNAYPQSEFIRTADPLFRPVNMVTAPDGTLYIVDMYRGIIQEGQWTPKDSYLREQIDALGMAREVGRGRIYRLVHDDFEPGPQPRMLDETPSDWLAHLAHPNGWWRDTAQKLLILERDLSVVPALRQLAAQAPDPRTRVHALWTLEGLDQIDPALIATALRDPHVEVVKSATRLTEPYLADHADLRTTVVALLDHADPTVTIQAMLSLKRGGVENAEALARARAEQTTSAGIIAMVEQAFVHEEEDPYLLPQLGPDGLKAWRAGQKFYNGLCFACHGPDGQGAPGAVEGTTLAPPLVGSPRVLGGKDPVINIVLHGLQGLVDGVDYHAPMVPMNTYHDEELAAVLTYIRNSFGNRSSVITPADVAARRPSRTGMLTPDELVAAFPALAVPDAPFTRRAEWTVDARFAPELAALAIDDDPETAYETARQAYPGQWFTVALPAVSTIKAITLESVESEDPSYPLNYDIHVSADGENWGEPILQGAGEVHGQIHFEEPVTTQYLRITLTRRQGWASWVIKDLQLYGDEG